MRVDGIEAYEQTNKTYPETATCTPRITKGLISIIAMSTCLAYV